MIFKSRPFLTQIFSSFLLINALFIIGYFVSNSFRKKAEHITNQQHTINYLNLLIHQKFESELEYLNYDSRSANYHENRACKSLENRKSLQSQIDSLSFHQIGELKSIDEKVAQKLEQLFSLQSAHNDIFNQIENKVFELGFQNWGVIGEMREYAHLLENNRQNILLAELLQLRRHEKDLLLRGDTNYAEKHIELLNKLISELPESRSIEREYLVAYSNKFSQVWQLHSELGKFYSHGLSKDLHSSFYNISRLASDMKYIISAKEILATASFKRAINIAAAISILLTLILSYTLAKNLSKPLKELNQVVNKVPKQGSGAFAQPLQYVSSETLKLFESFKMTFEELDRQAELQQEHASRLKEQYNELQKVNKELDQFVYSISHDLRAPLTSVMGLVELSKLESNPDKVESYHRMMETSLNRLDSFIQDILHYSRNARLEIQSESVDVDEMIHEVFNQLQFSEMADGIRLETRIDTNSEIWTDKRRLRMILNNLISNAVKYCNTQSTDRYVRVAVEAYDTKIHLQVSDNGIGIKTQRLPKIFQMFYRATEHSRGSGLGLYIVKEAVEMLGGTIEVHSVEGEGTTFSVHLPNFVSQQTQFAEERDQEFA